MRCISTKCEICSVNPAEYTCRMCGRRVCSEDYDEEEELCKICKTARCEVCKRQLAITTCKYCRRLVCEDCSIQISLVEYVCIDCYKKVVKNENG